MKPLVKAASAIEWLSNCRAERTRRHLRWCSGGTSIQLQMTITGLLIFYSAVSDERQQFSNWCTCVRFSRRNIKSRLTYMYMEEGIAFHANSCHNNYGIIACVHESCSFLFIKLYTSIVFFFSPLFLFVLMLCPLHSISLPSLQSQSFLSVHITNSSCLGPLLFCSFSLYLWHKYMNLFVSVDELLWTWNFEYKFIIMNYIDYRAIPIAPVISAWFFQVTPQSRYSYLVILLEFLDLSFRMPEVDCSGQAKNSEPAAS